MLLAAVLVGATSTTSACPFCTMQGKTLTGEVDDASMVLYGKLSNANDKAETTDIEIETIIKDNAVRGKQMKLTLNRFIDLSTGNPKVDRYIVFCDLFRGKIDPYRGLSLKAGSKLPEYLRGAIGLAEKKKTAQERFASSSITWTTTTWKSPTTPTRNSVTPTTRTLRRWRRRCRPTRSSSGSRAPTRRRSASACTPRCSATPARRRTRAC